MKHEKLRELLLSEGIDLFGTLSLGDCKITKEYLLSKGGISYRSVIIFAVPYLSYDFGEGNISEYAKSRDYHIYFKELFDRLIPRLKAEFGEFSFVGFSDHSPIDERHAAALAGLGVIGKHRLLITEKYSSFVFLGEIITDMPLESDKGEIGCCEGCELCLRSCPFALEPSERCLSAITQKKRELSEADAAAIISGGSVWGCDKCQKACPHTKKALEAKTIFTSVPFFLEKRLPSLTYRSVREMSDEEFSLRAYSWRGRETILRNLKLLEKDE